MSEALVSNVTPQAQRPRVDALRNGAATKGPNEGGRASGRRRGAEPYDALLWRLQSRQAEGADSISIGLIGCEDGAGTTTIATNLAVRACELGMGPVLLIETDADRPRLAQAWRLGAGPGLADTLTGRATLADALRPGPVAGLQVLAVSGADSTDGAWEAGVAESLLAEARGDYRMVLVDLPAANRLHGAVLLARRLDEVILVVRAERSRRQAIERVADRLVEDGVPLAGAVLNRRRTYLPRWLAGSR